MNIFVDLSVVFIVIFCVCSGYRKGFIRSFFNFFGGLISVSLASFLARPTGNFFANILVKPILSNFYREKIFRQISFDAIGSNSFDALSSFSSYASRFGVSQQHLQMLWERSENSVDAFAESFIDLVVSLVANSIGYSLSFIIIFIFVFILFKYLVKFFDLVSKLPFLNFSNRTLGLVFGFCFGVFVAAAFVAALVVVEPFLQNSNFALFRDFSLEKTYLINMFLEFMFV